MAPVTLAAAPAFVLVRPRGLELGLATLVALDAAGIAHREAAFPYAGDGHAPVVYLIDEERLRALGARPAIERALAALAADRLSTTVVLAERDSAVSWLADDPHVGGWLVAPPDGTALVVTVRAAAATFAARAALRTARGESERLLQIGLALSAERDITKLHQRIVHSARELTRADSGSLYLLETNASGERVLRFAVAQTGPQDAGTYLGAVLPLSRTSISGYVA
ncbi:MAG: hypothetical protein JO103_05390, partial [Candidatus Eremiobacteraeota bacterium]|nr:hypothetical protein [Candidatus Eremiobacteraeota bacterium]